MPVAGSLLVYVSCAGAREIVGFAMDHATGGLSRLNTTVLPGAPAVKPADGVSAAKTPSYSVPLTVSPDRTMLHAVLRTPPFLVVSYRIDPATGALAMTGETPIPASTPYIRTDRSGCYLFGAAYQGNCVWVTAIGADVAPDGLPVQVVEGIDRPHSIIFSHDNRFAWVAAAGGDELRQFHFDQARGRLEPNDPHIVPVEVGTGPRHLALHPEGRWLFCINETIGTIDAYAVDARRGTLTRSGNASMPSVDGPAALAADLHISPDGRFLYGSERAKDSISSFAISPESGALTYVDTTATDPAPRSFAVDPSGRFLVAAGQDTGRVSVFSIDPASGRFGNSSALFAGAGPSWVEIIAV